MSLREKAKSFNNGVKIEFMEGREKGDFNELINKECTIINYDFLSKDGNEYAVIIIDGIDDKFYFGGKMLTETLKEFTEEEKNEVIHDGLPVKFEKLKTKNGRPFVKVTYYPDELDVAQDDLPF